MTTCSRHLWNCYPYWDPRYQLLGPSKFLRRGNHLLCLCTHRPDSSLVHSSSNMLEQCILRGWDSVYRSILPAEKFLSYLIDSTQGTCFVIQDDNQSLNFPKVIRMYIQDFKRVTSQVLQCLCNLLICLPGLPG